MNGHEVEAYVRLYERHDEMNVPFVLYGDPRSRMCLVFLARLMIRRFGSRYLKPGISLLDSVVSYYQYHKRVWQKDGVDEDFLAWCLNDLATWSSFDTDYPKALEYSRQALSLTQSPGYKPYHSSAGLIWYHMLRILQAEGRTQQADAEALQMRVSGGGGVEIFYHIYHAQRRLGMNELATALDELAEVARGISLVDAKNFEIRINNLRYYLEDTSSTPAYSKEDFRARFLDLVESAIFLAKTQVKGSAPI